MRKWIRSWFHKAYEWWFWHTPQIVVAAMTGRFVLNLGQVPFWQNVFAWALTCAMMLIVWRLVLGWMTR